MRDGAIQELLRFAAALQRFAAALFARFDITTPNAHYTAFMLGTAFALSLRMAKIPRYYIIYDGCFFHITWKCHNEDWLLQWDWAKSAYYDLLLKYKDRYGVEFYAYNFMDNHPHLIGRMQDKERFSDFLRLVNNLLARIVNRRLKRKGQVVMDRFHSTVIESDEEMLRAMRYVDLNQQKAGKVDHPRENDWSSYRYYAYGEADPLITPSPSYLALSRDALKRRQEYRAIVETLIKEQVRLNISHSYFFGDPDWVLEKYRDLGEKLGRKRMRIPPVYYPAPALQD